MDATTESNASSSPDSSASSAPAARTNPWRTRLKWLGGALLISIAILAVVGHRLAAPAANIGAGYVAHQMCSCLFVARRTHDACRPDMLPMMDSIRSEVVDVEGVEGVRGWIPLLANRTALHTPGLGCALD